MSLREIILTAVVVILCIVALFRPRIGLYGYIWYAMMRPDVVAWSENEYPFSIALAIATFLGSMRYFAFFPRVWQNPVSKWLLILQVPLCLSVVFAVDPSLSIPLYIEYLKMLAVLFLIPILITTETDLRRLLLVIVVSLGYVGVQFGLFGIVNGGVIIVDGYGKGMLSDNNLLALALAMLVPICWFTRSQVASSLGRLGILGILFLSIAAIIMSNSRGGSLALAGALGLILFHSQRKIAAIALFAIFAGVAVYLVRDQYVARMETLRDVESEASAASRIAHAKVALAMWADHPIIGVGFGGQNYAALAESYFHSPNIHVVHNSYLQMLVDSGLFALIIYVGLLAGSLFWLGRSARSIGPEQLATPRALQASLLAFVIGGTFYSSQRYDLPYIILMCTGAWYMISRSENESAESDIPTADLDQIPAYPAI